MFIQWAFFELMSNVKGMRTESIAVWHPGDLACILFGSLTCSHITSCRCDTVCQSRSDASYKRNVNIDNWLDKVYNFIDLFFEYKNQFMIKNIDKTNKPIIKNFSANTSRWI